jgi:hypothetical protein
MTAKPEDRRQMTAKEAWSLGQGAGSNKPGDQRTAKEAWSDWCGRYDIAPLLSSLRIVQ